MTPTDRLVVGSLWTVAAFTAAACVYLFTAGFATIR